MMKKRVLLLSYLLGFSSLIFAQSPCPGSTAVGTASNIYTQILTEANPVAAYPGLNTVVFIHRNNASQFGGHSGQFRYDLSTNGGNTWTLNQGVLNATAVNGQNAGRYPSAAIYNPVGNTTPTNAYIAYLGPTVGTTWNGTVNGVEQLNGSGTTENYNQAVSTQTLIPRSMVTGAPGVYWAIDAQYNGTNVLGFRVLRGDWNAASSDVVWVNDTLLTPGFNTNYDANEHVADFQIDFDPSGQYGWICILTHLSSSSNPFQFYPVFYKTVDGGASWEGPEEVNLNEFACFTSQIDANNFATTAFDMDLVVDKKGNPHCLSILGQGPNSYSIYFPLWHGMYDITNENGIWNAIELEEVATGRGTWGQAPNEVTMDQEPQAARSDDGSRLFFFWTESDTALSTNDDRPNLKGIAYDVDTRSWTSVKDLSTCNATWRGNILFPKAAELALNISGGHKIPLVFAQLNTSGSALDPASFHFLDNVQFLDNEFVTPQCSLSVSLSALDTLIVCNSTTLTGPANADAYRWSTGATSSSITVTQSGTYWLGAQDACCTGGDTLVVIVENTPQAGFASTPAGLTVVFSDTSTGNPISWFWDFGDGNTSTQASPSHTYAAGGTYTVCLTSSNLCGTDSSCQSFTVSCQAPQAAFTASANLLSATFTDATTGSAATTWFWDFGDGNNSSVQNPTHTYAAAGTYQVCLTVSNACNSSQFCDSLTILCPVPISGFSSQQQGQTGTVDFTAQVSGNPTAYLWDFGDGNTSTQQNPIHTYINSGMFSVCLTVSNVCGSDSTCQNLNLVLDANTAPWLTQLDISPVPAEDYLLVEGRLQTTENLSLQVYDLNGKRVWKRELGASTRFAQRLALENWTSGMYLLEVRAGSKILRRRFVVR